LKTSKRLSGIDNKEVVHRLGDKMEHLLVDNKVLQNRRIQAAYWWVEGRDGFEYQVVSGF
jgi:hypothetical protein